MPGATILFSLLTLCSAPPRLDSARSSVVPAGMTCSTHLPLPEMLNVTQVRCVCSEFWLNYLMKAQVLWVTGHSCGEGCAQCCCCYSSWGKPAFRLLSGWAFGAFSSIMLYLLWFLKSENLLGSVVCLQLCQGRPSLQTRVSRGLLRPWGGLWWGVGCAVPPLLPEGVATLQRVWFWGPSMGPSLPTSCCLLRDFPTIWCASQGKKGFNLR